MNGLSKQEIKDLELKYAIRTFAFFAMPGHSTVGAMGEWIRRGPHPFNARFYRNFTFSASTS